MSSFVIPSAIRTVVPKIAATASTVPTTRGGGPPWMPVSCTAVWPLPRAISHRFTGTVSTKATASANESAPQNSRSERCASIAPGTVSMIRLSTTSMVAIEIVSEASAIGITALSARPARKSGRLVSV